MILNEETIRLILGLKIRSSRADKGISLTELAQQTGVSVSYLNEIEKGKKHPKPSKIALIADALDVPYDQLVSLEIDKKLLAVARLLSSEVMKELPLEHFGIDTSTLVDVFATAPAKFGAFVNTLIEIARSRDISVEQFYFDALRSYQEMRENYFGDLEQLASGFIEDKNIDCSSDNLLKQLEKILLTDYSIVVKYTLQQHESFKQLRSLYDFNNKELLINADLSIEQKAFVLAKEIGFQLLNIENRSYTSAWVKAESFDAVLNNFRTSYFAGALLVSCDQLIEDMEGFFAQRKWSAERLNAIMRQYMATPEVFMYRLTSILPKFFGLNQLFFLKFDLDKSETEVHLSKELHLSGLHNPHASFMNEHYCNRWISIWLLNDLENAPEEQWISGIQRSSYVDSTNEYLLFSVARRSQNQKSTVSIGLLINATLAQKVKFLNDETIPRRLVNITCERCRLSDCEVRGAEPKIYLQQQQQEQLMIAIQEYLTK
ncbi:helix-turn-helix domain-containing protein [Solitalea lacus]|uniref:helix-turn-helix domain-containing protein n=1 Tax=Solitalea lacus TaxID=2911172 RepID=UPI001EDAC1A7|nr:XRE family transcriptional regulator [Solitalea lacus]UKJ08387.1 XRE family transcriptional regulator [Solitalea lacus]